MKAKLEKISEQLGILFNEAEEKSGSENEKTAEKYDAVREHLETAIEAVDEAIGALE